MYVVWYMPSTTDDDENFASVVPWASPLLTFRRGENCILKGRSRDQTTAVALCLHQDSPSSQVFGHSLDCHTTSKTQKRRRYLVRVPGRPGEVFRPRPGQFLGSDCQTRLVNSEDERRHPLTCLGVASAED